MIKRKKKDPQATEPKDKSTEAKYCTKESWQLPYCRHDPAVSFLAARKIIERHSYSMQDTTHGIRNPHWLLGAADALFNTCLWDIGVGLLILLRFYVYFWGYVYVPVFILFVCMFCGSVRLKGGMYPLVCICRQGYIFSLECCG